MMADWVEERKGELSILHLSPTLPFPLTTHLTSGGSRPSAKEGDRLTMNVEFCEDNSSTSMIMRYFRKIGWGPSPGFATVNCTLK